MFPDSRVKKAQPIVIANIDTIMDGPYKASFRRFIGRKSEGKKGSYRIAPALVLLTLEMRPQEWSTFLVEVDQNLPLEGKNCTLKEGVLFDSLGKKINCHRNK